MPVVVDEEQPPPSLHSGISGINNAGFGLFATEKIEKGGVYIGRFGGQLGCGICARYHKKRSKYSVVVGDIEYGTGTDTMWHLVRTWDVYIDGMMWLINSSHRRNAIGYKHPNVYFRGEGFEYCLDGTIRPIVEVYSLCAIDANSELLADYMKNRATVRIRFT